MLRWMRRRLGGKGRGALGSLLNGTDEMWHATALRGREELEQQHRYTVPAPSPGDRLIEQGYVVLSRTLPRQAQDGSAMAPGTAPQPEDIIAPE